MSNRWFLSQQSILNVTAQLMINLVSGTHVVLTNNNDVF